MTIKKIIIDRIGLADHVRVDVASYILVLRIEIRQTCLDGHTVDDVLITGRPIVNPCIVRTILCITHHRVETEYVSGVQKLYQPARLDTDHLTLFLVLGPFLGIDGHHDIAQLLFVEYLLVNVMVTNVRESFFFRHVHLTKSASELSQIGIIVL